MTDWWLIPITLVTVVGIYTIGFLCGYYSHYKHEKERRVRV